MGLADADFVLLAEEAGRAALPEPLVEQAALAVPLLAEFAAEARRGALLPRAGKRRGTRGRRASAESVCERRRPASRTGCCVRRRCADTGERGRG